jgi:hypothetical protein
MSKFYFHCEEATRKMIEAEEKKLLLADRLRLGWHLIICKWCRLFMKQNTILNQSMNEVRRTPVKEDITLTASSKIKIQQSLDEAIKGKE